MQFASMAEPLRVVYFENYEPISWLDEGTMHGVLVDIVNEAISRRMGIAVEHRGYPWARAQELVKRGLADAFLTVVTPERAQFTIFGEESVLSLDNVAYTSFRHPRRAELEKAQNLDDLRQYTLADYFGNGWAKKHLGEHHVYWVPGMSNALRMVSAGRVDSFIEARQVVRYHIHKLNLDAELMELKPILDTVEFRLCIGVASAFSTRLKLFDQTIREMRKDGTLGRIYAKYLIDTH